MGQLIKLGVHIFPGKGEAANVAADRQSLLGSMERLFHQVAPVGFDIIADD